MIKSKITLFPWCSSWCTHVQPVCLCVWIIKSIFVEFCVRLHFISLRDYRNQIKIFFLGITCWKKMHSEAMFNTISVSVMQIAMVFIHLTFNTKQAIVYLPISVDVHMSSLYVCVCLDFLMSVADFFVKGLPSPDKSPPAVVAPPPVEDTRGGFVVVV